ncbi:MAG: TPR end-of-group domain-containing protein [Myxococcota bacterium]
MIRFRFAGVPVVLHMSHLLFSGLIAWSFLGWKGAQTSWPTEALANVNHPRHHATQIGVWLGWTVLVSLTVLMQLLGHAVAVRRFGRQPELHLVGLGGRTLMEGQPRLEWWQETVAALAGPAGGLLLAVLAGGLVLFGGTSLPEPVRYFGRGVFVANLWWSALNMVPVSGLAGGVIATQVLTRLFGRIGFLFAQLIALGLAALLLLFSFLAAQPLLGVLVIFMTLRTAGNIGAWQRGELPLGEAAHPTTAVIERAEALYRERRLEEAALLARGIADAADTPPLLRSRAFLLLGWIALKEGAGRRALDSFAQVQGLPVPPHALGAGFSLVGDEARAIPFWAQAAQLMPHDEVIRHEFAGALIRGGREAEARALPGVQLARAFAAAERVHYVRREFEAAARASEAAFTESKEPSAAYTAACAWALAGRTDDAMRLLALAADAGFRNASEAREDPDLRSLRGRPDFEAWLGSLTGVSASR